MVSISQTTTLANYCIFFVVLFSLSFSNHFFVASDPAVVITSDAGTNTTITTAATISFTVSLPDTASNFDCSTRIVASCANPVTQYGSICTSTDNKKMMLKEESTATTQTEDEVPEAAASASKDEMSAVVGEGHLVQKAFLSAAIITCTANNLPIYITLYNNSFSDVQTGEMNSADTVFVIYSDRQGPKATFTSTTANLTNSATNTITITFDKQVYNFSSASLSFNPTSTHATINSVESSLFLGTSALTGWVVNKTRVVVEIVGASVSGSYKLGFASQAMLFDDLGNMMLVSSAPSINITYDITPPTASISSSVGNLTNNPTNTFTLTFSEPVLSCCSDSDLYFDPGTTNAVFTKPSLSVSSALTKVGCCSYLLLVSNATASGTYFLALVSSTVTDLAGNVITLQAANNKSVAVDLVRPVPTITASECCLVSRTTNTLTIDFSKDVQSFSSSSLVFTAGVTNATIGAVTTVSSRRYTVVVSNAGFEGTYSLNVTSSTTIDVVGNPTVPASVAITTDFTRPTLNISSPQLSTNGSFTNSSSVNISISISKIPRTFSLATMSVSGCDQTLELSTISSTQYMVFCERSVGAGNGEVSVAVPSGYFLDLAGNQNIQAPVYVVFIDRVPPTISVCLRSNNVLDVSLATTTDTLTLTVTPSEPLIASVLSVNILSTALTVSSVANSNNLVASRTVLSTDPQENVQFVVSNIRDRAGNYAVLGTVTDSSCGNVLIDTIAPSVSACLVSNNTGSNRVARTGNKISLSFAPNEHIWNIQNIQLIDIAANPVVRLGSLATLPENQTAVLEGAVLSGVMDGVVRVWVSEMRDATGNTAINFTVTPTGSCKVTIDDLPPAIELCSYSNNDMFSTKAKEQNIVYISVNSSKALRTPVQIQIHAVDLQSIVTLEASQIAEEFFVAQFEIASATNLSIGNVNVNQGLLDVSATVYDGAGNPGLSNSSICTLVVDTITPTFRMIVTSNNPHTPSLATFDNAINFTVIASEPIRIPTLILSFSNATATASLQMSLNFSIVRPQQAEALLFVSNDLQSVDGMTLQVVSVVVADLAGNQQNTPTSVSGTIKLDLTPPSISSVCLTSSNTFNTTAARAFDSITAAIAISEPLLQLPTFSSSVASIVLSNLALDSSNASVSSSTTNYKTLVGVAGSVQQTVLVQVANVLDLAGNVGVNYVGSGTCSRIYADTIRPTVQICTTSSNVRNYIARAGETVTISMTFSELIAQPPQLTFANQNILLSNLLYPRHTFSVNVSISANVQNGNATATLNSSTVVDLAGNTASGLWAATGACDVIIDTISPTVTIISSTFTPTNIPSINFTVTFSEPILNFSIAYLNVSASCSNPGFLKIGSLTYVVACAAIANNQLLSLTVSLPQNAVSDFAGNLNSEVSRAVVVDTQLPWVINFTADSNNRDASLRPRAGVQDTIYITVDFNKTVCRTSSISFLIAGKTASILSPSLSSCATTISAQYLVVGDENNLLLLNGLAVITVAAFRDTVGNLQPNWRIDLNDYYSPTATPVPTPTSLVVDVHRCKLQTNGIPESSFNITAAQIAFSNAVASVNIALQLSIQNILITSVSSTKQVGGLLTVWVYFVASSPTQASQIQQANSRAIQKRATAQQLQQLLGISPLTVTLLQSDIGTAVLNPVGSGYSADNIFFVATASSGSSKSNNNVLNYGLIFMGIVLFILIVLFLIVRKLSRMDSRKHLLNALPFLSPHFKHQNNNNDVTSEKGLEMKSQNGNDNDNASVVMSHAALDFGARGSIILPAPSVLGASNVPSMKSFNKQPGGMARSESDVMSQADLVSQTGDTLTALDMRVPLELGRFQAAPRPGSANPYQPGTYTDRSVFNPAMGAPPFQHAATFHSPMPHMLSANTASFGPNPMMHAASFAGVPGQLTHAGSFGYPQQPQMQPGGYGYGGGAPIDYGFDPYGGSGVVGVMPTDPSGAYYADPNLAYGGGMMTQQDAMMYQQQQQFVQQQQFMQQQQQQQYQHQQQQMYHPSLSPQPSFQQQQQQYLQPNNNNNNTSNNNNNKSMRRWTEAIDDDGRVGGGANVPDDDGLGLAMDDDDYDDDPNIHAGLGAQDTMASDNDNQSNPSLWTGDQSRQLGNVGVPGSRMLDTLPPSTFSARGDD